MARPPAGCLTGKQPNGILETKHRSTGAERQHSREVLAFFFALKAGSSDLAALTVAILRLPPRPPASLIPRHGSSLSCNHLTSTPLTVPFHGQHDAKGSHGQKQQRP